MRISLEKYQFNFVNQMENIVINPENLQDSSDES